MKIFNMIKVKLISYTKDPEKTCVSAIRQCYAYVSADKIKQSITQAMQKRLIKLVLSSGHTSTLEHANFTFAVQGISRTCTHQLVRHRIASYSQQSQRYVKMGSNFNYIIPPAIGNNKKFLKIFKNQILQAKKVYDELIKAGFKKEDARFLLPNSSETKIVITMNARALLHFFEKRLCIRAQWEIRQMADLMLKQVKKIAPNIFRYAGPTCKTQKICWEGDMSCGLYKSIKGGELRSRC